MEIKKLYYNSCNFNQVRIIKELYKIIKENGGYIVSDWEKKKEKILYINRSVNDVLIENKKWLEVPKKDHYKTLTEDQKKKIKSKIDLYNTAKKMEETGINKAESFFDTYIQFYYKDYIYYYQFEKNPFFDYYFSKIPAESDLKQYYNYYMEKIDEKYKENKINANIWNLELKDKEAKKIALNIFNYLISARSNEIVTNKKRVYNLYDGGYHYEYIKEKREKKYNKIEIED